VLVLDTGTYRNRWVEMSHGYFGFDPAPPSDLHEAARKGLERYPTVEVREALAETACCRDDGLFSVRVEGDDVIARRLVLATGVRDAFPDITGFLEHYGSSVFHCPTCDGYEAKDRPVVVVGWSENIVGFALTLLNWASTVTVVTDGRTFEGDEAARRRLNDEGVAIREDTAIAMRGERGELEGLELRSGELVECDLAFFSIAHHPVTDLAEALGCDLDEEGYVIADDKGMTTIKGVYAAGDLTPGLQLVQVAAAKGAVAGVACALSLSEYP
jgi:thioredoxin reductase